MVLLSINERKGTVETDQGVFDYYTLRTDYDLRTMNEVWLCEINDGQHTYAVFEKIDNEIKTDGASFFNDYREALRIYARVIVLNG